jgi:putative ABC transport system substrate-binding protein
VQLKRLQLLVEAMPGVSTVAVLGDAQSLSSEPWRSAAESLGVTFIPLPDPSRDGYEAAVQHAVAQRADSLLILRGLGIAPNAELLGNLAARYGLPGIASERPYVVGGGLMAYVDGESESGRRAAEYVDRILHGASPADLPVEQPTRYDLIVNLRTAQDLGLTLPPAFLARVNEMIE